MMNVLLSSPLEWPLVPTHNYQFSLKEGGHFHRQIFLQNCCNTHFAPQEVNGIYSTWAPGLYLIICLLHWPHHFRYRQLQHMGGHENASHLYKTLITVSLITLFSCFDLIWKSDRVCLANPLLDSRISCRCPGGPYEGHWLKAARKPTSLGEN